MANRLADQFRVLHPERLSNRGVLVIPMRLAFDELLVLENHLKPREIVYLLEETAVLDAPLRSYLGKEGITTLQFNCRHTLPLDLGKELRRQMEEGHLVIFVPGKSRTCPKPATTIPSALLKFLLQTGVRVQCLVVDRPYEWRFAIEDDLPDPGPLFAFAPVMEEEAASLANFQEMMMEVWGEAFGQHALLGMHLGFAVLSGLKRSGATSGIIDGNDGSETPYGKILAASLALSNVIKSRTAKARVGIILPAGRGGMMANIAVLLANKVPVNLNFTASRDAVSSAIDQADLDLYLTADAFRQKMRRFAWPEEDQLLFLEQALPKIKWKMAFWLLMSRLCNPRRLAGMIGLPRDGGDREAVLLFTSGSSGAPKGVALTHTNVLANVSQFGSRLNLSQTDCLLGCLPLFHSFGCTVTMWYPMVEGYTVVTYPNPVETKKLAELIQQYRVTLVLGTPTFLRGYLRKATKDQFASVKLVVSGAEKLPVELSEAFDAKLGLEILEGYGLTETSPVTNVNLADPDPGADPNVPAIPCRRRGSVGQFLPGVAVRITDPDTELPLPIHETGMIWLSGANIFGGYLNAPEKSAEVLRGEWFKTGDIGRLDEDGFLYIEGRLSRFSKIGGEMVPHETVESYLNKTLQFGSSDERKLTVVGVPDKAKGEALVMLCVDKDLDFEALRKRLIADGVPNLWIPKKWVHVDAVPALASGKLDICACQDAAAQV